jgi:hypothetical protein
MIMLDMFVSSTIIEVSFLWTLCTIPYLYFVLFLFFYVGQSYVNWYESLQWAASFGEFILFWQHAIVYIV